MNRNPESYKMEIETLLAGLSPGGFIKVLKDNKNAHRYRRQLYRVRSKFAGGPLPVDVLTLRITVHENTVWIHSPYETHEPAWDEVFGEVLKEAKGENNDEG